MKLSVTLKYNSDMAYESIWHRLRHDFGSAAPFWQSDVAANPCRVRFSVVTCGAFTAAAMPKRELRDRSAMARQPEMTVEDHEYYANLEKVHSVCLADMASLLRVLLLCPHFLLVAGPEAQYGRTKGGARSTRAGAS